MKLSCQKGFGMDCCITGNYSISGVFVSELLNYLISWRISLGKLSSLAGQEIPVT
jgi:hypothetical protein